jgi:hypothetical protein
MPEKHYGIKKQNIGNAGEYYIAAVLSSLNFTTTITLGRAERYDILAVGPTGKTFKLSVKTRFKGKESAFTLSEKDERNWEDDLLYVLVRLHEFRQTPEYWVIPSKRVSEVIAIAHQKWRETPGRTGQTHNFSAVRKIPVVLRGMDNTYYPSDWEEEMKKYYMNFKTMVGAP